MKRWGVAVTTFYVFAVAVLFVPGWLWLWHGGTGIWESSLDAYSHWLPWTWIGLLGSGQALLLFLSVDSSWRRTKPRQHVAVTCALASFYAALLTCAAIWSLVLGISEDKLSWLMPFGTSDTETLFTVAAWWIGLWTLWGTVFHLYRRGSVEQLSWAMSWLLKGSVLELLIAVPAHVAVRYRNECSAPAVTSWGIVTGLAVMLLCFGPGVLALYRKKFDAYSSKGKRRVEDRT